MRSGSGKWLRALSLLALGLLYPQVAFAFPFALGPASQFLVTLFLSGAMLLSITRKSFLIWTVIILSLGMSGMTLMYLEKSYLEISGQAKVPYPEVRDFSGRFNWKAHLITPLQAKALDQQKNTLHITLSSTSQPFIEGLPLFDIDDINKLEDFISGQNNVEAVVIYTRYISNGFLAIETLSSLPVEFYVVDTQNEGQQRKLLEAMPENGKSAIAEPQERVFKSRKESLEDYNVVSLINESWASSYFPADSSLLLYSDLISDIDGRLAAIINDHDKKPIYFLTGNNSQRTNQTLADYFAKLIPDHRPVYTATMTYGQQSWYSLPNDNFVTKPFRGGTSRIDPSDLYVYLNNDKKITIYCFSDECANYFPGDTELLKVEVLNGDSLLSYKQGLDVSLDMFDRDRGIIFSPHDAASGYMTLILSQRLASRGYDYLGFTDHYSIFFGTAELSEGADANNVIIDEPRTVIIAWLKDMTRKISPSSPISISGSELIILFMFIGFVYMLGLPLAAISMASFLLPFLMFDQWFVMGSASYYQYAFNPFVLMALSVMVMVLNKPSEQDWKTLCIGLLVFVPIGWFTYQYIPPPKDRLLGGFMLGIILIAITWRVIAATLITSRFYPTESLRLLGSKASLTLAFVGKKDRGFVLLGATPPSKVPLLIRLRRTEWILRSNHLSSQESGAAGIFESCTVSSSELIEKTNAMIGRLKARGLREHEIQFWLQPYRRYVKTGVMTSHSNRSETKFSFSLGEPGAATGGSTNHLETWSRDKRGLPLRARRLLRKLRSIESKLGQPVILEFGLGRYGRIDILQVRPLKLPSYFDELNSRIIRQGIEKSMLVDHRPYTLLDQSVLTRLYGDQIFFDGNSVFRRYARKRAKFSNGLALQVQHSIMAIYNGVSISRYNVTPEEMAGELSELLSAVINSEVSRSDKKSNDQLNPFIENVLWSASKGLILKDHFCVSSEPDFNYDPSGLQKTNHVHREMIHLLTAMCVGLVRGILIQQDCLSSDLPINRQRSGPPQERPNPDSSNESVITVVTGELPERRVDMETFLGLSDREKKGVTVESDIIPDCHIDEVRKSGGIITTYGTELSHLALTCKYYNVPYLIDGRRK